MRAGYLGPEGTFTHEALTASAGSEALDLVALPTIYDTVMAVGEGQVERALVPIENSLEGSVNATLDALAMETEDVVIVGELVHPIRHCLIARAVIPLDSIDTVVSIPQATAQCARFIRARLRNATVMPANSTADAVRLVAEAEGTWAALGNRLAAELYACEVLQAGVEDLADNETRFVWLARKGADTGARGAVEDVSRVLGRRRRRPGLARALPVGVRVSRRQPHADRVAPAQGRPGPLHVLRRPRGPGHRRSGRGAIEAVRGQTEELRVLGSYPAA